ncbi:MAG: 16S rRNA (cytosine(967)-C(5))-methyltransferase RsmB [Lachnospiraceae bacterium]|nr:16S rRNA (cytosine(967)-C(5))-methyltransferase RsmB [Lachnospiraceae bacterium]
MSTREILLEMLMDILERGKYSHLTIKAVLDKYAYLSRSDRAFIRRVCTGCVERCIQLDYLLNQLSTTRTEKMKPVIRTILRMGAYQILFMDKVPDRAACNEAVKLAEKKGFGRLKGFVNGVLRNLSRQKETLAYPDRKESPAFYLSVMYSMPDWIVDMWLAQYGEAKTEQILKGLLEERPLTLRMDEGLSLTEREQLLCEVRAAGIDIEPCVELDYAYRVGHTDAPDTIPGFADGRWMIQDLGSMLITQFAGIREKDTVIDVCGAPGGKAIHAAAKTGREGHVFVRDMTPYKLSLIEENLARTTYRNITPQRMDATVFDEASVETADVLLADLPCSGLGVIGRKPDIKYRIRPEELEEVAALQRKILQTVHPYVKKGGTLLYSTCTLDKKENEENVSFILQKLPFSLDGTRELLPGIDGTDGFFMARFKRI